MKDSISLEFLKRTDGTPDRLAFKIRRNNAWHPVTWGEIKNRAERIFHFMLRLGLAREDHVAILSENSVGFVCADHAIMASGAVSVPIYPTNTAEQVGYVLAHSESVGVFVSTRRQGEKVCAILAQCPKLRWIIVLNEGEALEHDKAVPLSTVLEEGGRLRREAPHQFADSVRDLDHDLVCTIIYTSGTTGPPKGTMLTHKSCLAACRAIRAAAPVTSEDRAICYLPWCHVYGRIAELFLSIMLGTWGAIVDNMDALMDSIQEVGPTLFNSVPRLYEKIYNAVYSRVAGAPPAQQKIFRNAIAIGKEYVRVKFVERRSPSVLLSLRYRIAEKMVFAKLRKKIFGGDLHFVGVGAAPISEEILWFFHAIGIPILEGYGQTESSCIASMNLPEPGKLKFGTVGRAFPGIRIKIADDGEIMIAGDVVMKGYFKDPDATAEAVEDGWLHSGDLGTMDEEGFLKITGRKKEIIITAGGKNITPANIEARMKMNPFIDEFVAYGDRRKYLTGILAPDFEVLEKWARDCNIPYKDREELVNLARVREHLKDQVQAVNKELPSYETIKDVAILAHGFSMDRDELTPTNKVKRRNVYKNYGDRLDALYQTEIGSDKTLVSPP